MAIHALLGNRSNACTKSRIDRHLNSECKLMITSRVLVDESRRPCVRDRHGRRLGITRVVGERSVDRNI